MDSEVNRIDPAAKLNALVHAHLQHAVDGALKGIKVYESLRNLNEVIGTQYSDRVLYELIQNAHDAHGAADQGKIAITLKVSSHDRGILYVANGGSGFSFENVEAVRNLAISSKEVGEGIGNKGLGFRSIEALTDDVRIYSKHSGKRSNSFDGFCFRFATRDEIEKLVGEIPNSASVKTEVANTIPRYLVSVPLVDQSADVSAFAQAGYATVIALPLRTESAVQLATEQVKALNSLNVPLLLFLDRIAEVRLDLDLPNEPPVQRVLRRNEEPIEIVGRIEGCSLHRVEVGDQHPFLVVRLRVDKARVIEAVEKSIATAPQLRRWRDWKGDPIVSIAISLDRKGVTSGRLYNFLPMGDAAIAPMAGYLDAPFFTDIDRTQAKLDLPLNSLLITAAAEACASAALHIVKHNVPVPTTAAFDLIAWTSPFTSRIDDALKSFETSLREVELLPVLSVDNQKSWTSLAKATIWPAGKFKVLKPREVAKLADSSLISPVLGERRLERARSLARSPFTPFTGSLAPSAFVLGQTLESFALALSDRSASPRTWATFYEESVRVCLAAGANLNCLDGKQIFLDRSGKLRSAIKESNETQRQVYVRGETRARKSSGIPLPPQSLSRRYIFLDERILLDAETLQAFVKAKLLRPYDPVEALAGLPAALGNQPSEERRSDALVWAFELWKTSGAGVEDALRKADLFVPTQKGWKSARVCVFSESWTRIGSLVEIYLIESSPFSNDCVDAIGTLLISWPSWPKRDADIRRDWIDFLAALGVADSLRPVAAPFEGGGYPSWLWNPLVRSGKPDIGFDGDWCAEAASATFSYPNTYYRMKGEGWRFPGQVEFSKLPDNTKRTFSYLIFEHLKQNGNAFFQFSVGRYERHERDWNEQVLPTPLAVFVRTKSWIAANSADEVTFCKPLSCWSARIRRAGLPRFVSRLPEQMVDDVLDDQKLSLLLFSDAVGLRDWQSRTTAPDRLYDLAVVAHDVSSIDRAVFRREYRRAWLDVSETKAALGYNLSIITSRRGELDVLNGDFKAPPEIIMTNDPSRFEVKALSDAGRAVLDIGDASIEVIKSLLTDTLVFRPLSLNDVQVQLMVDGEVFQASASDPLLVDSGLHWLPECAAIGHAIRGEQLEKGVLRATIEGRIRAIRVRYSESISLLIDGTEHPSQEEISFYAFDGEIPTLILSKNIQLDWRTLALTAESISRLVDTRIRSFKTLISDLYIVRSKQRLEEPTPEDYAGILKCDIEIIQEHILEFRTDVDRVVQMLLPIVAYFEGAVCARRLRSDFSRLGAAFDPEGWLENNQKVMVRSPAEIVDACSRSADRSELRSLLDLDFARFNHILSEMGEPLLSNEQELRLSYQAHLQNLKPEIIDRLRRFYHSSYISGDALDSYTSQKSLEFIDFNETWIATQESLERELVEAHVSRTLDEVVGADLPVDLVPISRLLESNRKTVLHIFKQAAPLILVWCKKNNSPIPALWASSDPQAVARHLENKGLLDFEPIEPYRVPQLARRADCWPLGMKESVDLLELGLLQSDLEEEARDREDDIRKRIAARRTIVFAGSALDTGADDFSDTFVDIAEQAIGADSAWYDRSRAAVKLESFAESSATIKSNTGGGFSGARWRETQPSEAQRQAMGMAGEWLAYRYLLKRHEGYVDEASWISENRRHFFGGDLGNDGAGYDFRVVTPRVEWLYEVKSTSGYGFEFEITANELRVASGASKDRRLRYRVLYVRHVFSPSEWHILELPNPMGQQTRSHFQTVGHGSLRLRFSESS